VASSRLYILGDIQGHFNRLQHFLDTIQFNPYQDRLGFAGDLVNRGPQSLAVLQFIRDLDSPIVVLGNHDLHLLAVGYEVIPRGAQDTFTDVLQSPEKIALLDWLRTQKIMHHAPQHQYCLVHAGIPPQWSIEDACYQAQLLEQVLQSNDYLTYLQHMHGNTPNQWSEQLSYYDRLRYITNAFTRMRFCNAKGDLELHHKGKESPDASQWRPWFEYRSTDPSKILFGHWSTLKGECSHPNVVALDVGDRYGLPLKAYQVPQHPDQ
jgi:bis(5'-nucleosyl)-tetraphosphatase (symmetrical)